MGFLIVGFFFDVHCRRCRARCVSTWRRLQATQQNQFVVASGITFKPWHGEKRHPPHSAHSTPNPGPWSDSDLWQKPLLQNFCGDGVGGADVGL